MSIHPADVIAVLVETSVRISLVALIVGLVIVALRIRAGAVCHAAWTAVVVTMLLLPVMPKWLPAIPVWMPERPVAARTVDSLPAPTPAQKPTPRAAIAANTAAPLPGVAAPVSSAVAAPASPAFPWPLAIVLTWLAVSFAMLTRLGVGWRRAARLAADATPLSETPSLFESGLVATPVTVGVLFPRVILPTDWTTWPIETREAVLLHEREHIRRRDTLINVLASVNRSVFWFHPLAWWLERRLAVAAEQACDDAVVRTSGQAERYANLLVTMAEAVRVRGARVEWQGVGMAGGGSLDARIDRVLSGAATLATGRVRKVVVSLACVTAITLAVACQRTVPPLRPNPEIAERLAKQKAEGDKYEAARNMTLDQVAAVEAQVAKNPEDLDARGRLLTFYSSNGQKLMGWNAMVAARRSHLLYLIEHHPESDRIWWPMKQSLDPTGWAQARVLWMKHVEKPDVTSKILGRAAWFFRISEKAVAEQMLLRAMAMDPQGPQPRVVDNTYYSPWAASLGQLYAQAIVGSDDDTMFNVVRSVSLEVANGPFATTAQKKLAESTDAAMLRAAGQYLTDNTGGNPGMVGDQKLNLGFDFVALGESYLDRAAMLDPNSETTKRFEYYRKVRVLDEVQSSRRRAILVKSSPLSERGEQVVYRQGFSDAMLAKLSDSDRFEVLPDLATHAYFNGENTEYAKKDRAIYEASFARAGKLADETLALAEKFKTDPRHGPSQFSAHVTRALIALRAGDRRLAVTHMRAATDGLRTTDVMTSWDSQLHSRLGNYLLNWGERESVAYFYENLAKYEGLRGNGLIDAAKAIRAGMMPEGYQYSVTPH